MQGNRPNSWWWRLWDAGCESSAGLVLLVCLLAGGPAWADADDASQQRRAVLADAHAETAERHAAALALLGEEGHDPIELLEPVLSVLAASESEAQADLAAALARLSGDEMIDQLAALAGDANAPSDTRLAALRALGHHRSPRAAAALMAFTAPDRREATRHAAYAALASLTGLQGLGNNAAAWDAWWQEAKAVPVDDWQQYLFDQLVRQHQQTRQRQQVLESRLVDAHRSLYRAAAVEERPMQLMRLLEDPLPLVRQLGLDLAVQRLVDDQPFDEPLRQMLRARLDDASPVIRQRATLLLRDLADPPAADRVAQRLATGTEQVEAVLRADLLMMSRLPRIEAVERSLELLGHRNLRSEAAGAIAAAVDADRLTYQQGVRALGRLRADLDAGAAPLPSIVLLLGKLGGESDWQRIEGWLESEDAGVKQAAAQAWAESERSLSPLVARLNDPVIEPVATLAVARRGKSAATFRLLIRHAPADEPATERWQRALEAMAGRVSPDVMLGGVRELEKRGGTSALSRRMLDAAVERADESPQAAAAGDRVGLLLARARLRLAAGEAEAALADFDRLARMEPGLTAAQREQRHRGVIEAALWMDQLDRAFETAQVMLQELADAGEDGEAVPEPGLLSENDSPLDLLFEAADQSLATGELDRLERLIVGMRALIGAEMGPALLQRIAALEAHARHLSETVDDAEARPADPPAPSDAEASRDGRA